MSSSSANSYLFLKPILTANALATVQANPVLLAYALATIGGMIFLIALSFFISFQTGKAYRKPKGKGDNGNRGKNGLAGVIKALPFVGKK